MSNDEGYIRRRIEEVIAELDRPGYITAIETESLGPPDLRFETVLEKSGTILGELHAAVLAMKADELVAYREGDRHLTVLNEFRRKHGYHIGDPLPARS